MTHTTLNIHKFAKTFAEIYNELYNSESERDARLQVRAAEVFDECMRRENFRNFVSEFAAYRGDIIASDREAASFILTIDALREA